jgi:hypothetical protein
VQGHPRVKPPHPARRQIIDHYHLIAPGDERISQMRTNKPSTTGHENPHNHRS